MQHELTKKQSTMIQGIAILLMVYHHFFLSPSTVPGITYGNEELTQRIAWFGKLCVGLFCFISGYGMYHVFTKLPHDRVDTLLLQGWKTVLVRLLHLYMKLWAVIFIFKGIDFLILKKPFDFSELLGNLTAVNVSYNGTWWFVGQYVFMLLILPFIDLFFTRFSDSAQKKKQAALLGSLLTLAVVVFFSCYFASPELRFWILQVKNNVLRPAFTLAFCCGYFFARFCLFSRFRALCLRVGNWFLTLTAFLSLLGCIVLRMLLARDASFASPDFIFAPMLIFGAVELLSHCRFLPKLFYWFGSCSTYLWLIHVLVFDNTINLFADFFAPYGGMPSTLFYLAQLAISTPLAALFTLVEKHLVRRRKVVV